MSGALKPKRGTCNAARTGVTACTNRLHATSMLAGSVFRRDTLSGCFSSGERLIGSAPKKEETVTQRCTMVRCDGELSLVS